MYNSYSLLKPVHFFVFCCMLGIGIVGYESGSSNSSIVKKTNSLTKLGNKYATDKFTHHGYQRFYAMYLDRNINSMLEIGIAGRKSLKVWLEYFPKAYIYGADINSEGQGYRFKIFKTDQSKISDLKNLNSSIGHKVDVIIDDGSHVPEHQLLSFEYLFSNTLKDGGVYIIEDVECNYWNKNDVYGYKTEYGAFNEHNLVNVFNPVVQLLNQEFINQKEKEQILAQLKISPNLVNSISTITFGQNCIIVQKKQKYEYAYNNREYRFRHNI